MNHAIENLQRNSPGAEWERSASAADVFAEAQRIVWREADSFLRCAERVSFARMFCASAVEVLWRNAFRGETTIWSLPQLFVPMSGLPKSSKFASVALAVGEAASTLELNAAAYLIHTMYATLLPESQRVAWGTYSTPPHLVRRLVETASRAGVDWRTCRVCDPACGAGTFLAASVERIVGESSGVEPKLLLRALSQRVRGWDIDPFAAWLAQIFVEISLLEVCRRAGQRLPSIIEVGDTLLRPDISATFDLVIGHPPSGRATLLQEVRYRYRRSLDVHADRYSLFTDFAIRSTRHRGVIAYVTPASIFNSGSFKSLRALLATEARPVNIDFVSGFDETLLATYMAGSTNSIACVQRISTTRKGLGVTETGCLKFSTRENKPWTILWPAA
jgi:adenine-specific DNA-methyltransferase